MTKKWKGILSPSSLNNQPVQSFENCVDWLLYNLIQRGILSPSSPNNQADLSINNCINELLCNLIQRGIFLLPLPTIYQFCHQWLHGLTTLWLNPSWILSPSPPNNQPVSSALQKGRAGAYGRLVLWESGTNKLNSYALLHTQKQRQKIVCQCVSTVIYVTVQWQLSRLNGKQLDGSPLRPPRKVIWKICSMVQGWLYFLWI